MEKSLNYWIGKIGNIKRVIIPPMSIYWLWGMTWLRVLLLSPRWDAMASQGNPYPQTFFSTWPTKTLVCIYTLRGEGGGSPSKERHRASCLSTLEHNPLTLTSHILSSVLRPQWWNHEQMKSQFTIQSHATYLTVNALTFINVCLTVDTSISRHAQAAVPINHVSTAATILT